MPSKEELVSVASIASRHKMMRSVAENEACKMTKFFILMCADHDPNRLWDLLEARSVWKKMDSSVFGITSIINDYTNKKGETFKAHFTINGKFIKKVGNDTSPISYIGNFRVCKALFQIDTDELDDIVIKYETGDEIDISDLFVCKDTDDIPLEYMGNRGRIALGNY